MLDLSAISGFYELKWFDGEVIHLKKPTEAFLRSLQAFAENSTEDSAENMSRVREIVRTMVKDNEEGRKFTAKELDRLDFLVSMMILKDYMQTVEQRLGE